MFFRQSCAVDKRIIQHFVKYERFELWIGFVIVAALAIMALSQSGGAGAPAEEVAAAAISRRTWRMPPLNQLPPAKLSLAA